MVTEVWLQDADKSQACVLPANVLQPGRTQQLFRVAERCGWKGIEARGGVRQVHGDGVTVVNGLNEGDEVIVEGQQKVCEGTPLAL